MIYGFKLQVDTSDIVEELDEYIDRVHNTFAEEMKASLVVNTPFETGEMMRAWTSRRDNKHHTTVFNPTKQAKFLQGTGKWGPTGEPIRPRTAKYLCFYWRYMHYEFFKKRQVAGINPHNVHGAPGEVYDFIMLMNTAIKNGWSKTLERIR